VFEGLRTLLLERTFDAQAMLIALTLNLFYLAAASVGFALLLRSARRSGSLMQTGE
jgi:ABC-2 type transport system permease protein